MYFFHIKEDLLDLTHYHAAKKGRVLILYCYQYKI